MKSGNGDVTEYDDKSLAFFDLCGESGTAFPKPGGKTGFEDSSRGDGDRRRLACSMGDMICESN